MSSSATTFSRPPLGFIVEGYGEYYCYPSLVSKITGHHGIKTPISNVKGYGNIVKHLQDELTTLVRHYHPLHVLVSTDLKELIADKIYSNCKEACEQLHQQASDWLAMAQGDKRLQPLPKRIVIVLQVQKFETWLLSDIDGLKNTGLLIKEFTPIKYNCANMDVFHEDPATALKKILRSGYDIKNPRIAREIVTKLDPTIMMQRSHSFDKFAREVSLSYKCWLHMSEYALGE